MDFREECFMKTKLGIPYVMSLVLIWIIGFCLFIPYNLKTVECDDEMLNEYFSAPPVYAVADKTALEEHSEELKNCQYQCLSPDAAYELLKNPPSGVKTYHVIQKAVFSNIYQLSFFTCNGEYYALCTFRADDKDFARVLPLEYAIFSVADFPDTLKDAFINSDFAPEHPAELAATEAMLQNVILTVLYTVVFVATAFPLSVFLYKKKKEKQPFITDDETTGSDIKNYIKRRMGKAVFDEKELYLMPCVSGEASHRKAAELIKSMAKEYGNEEIFIGPFFESRTYLGDMTQLTVFIREFLDENSYSVLKLPDNEHVIDFITQGNMKEETSISLYLDHPGILIVPVPGKVYVFGREDDTLKKLNDIALGCGLGLFC